MRTPEVAWSGFALARAAVPAAACARLRGQALAAAARQRFDLRHLFAQALGRGKPIRESRRRVHLLLDELSSDVALALRCSLARFGEDTLTRTGLTPDAELVELSVMLAFPGAAEQRAHTDVPPDSLPGMCTVWCALQDTDATMGPTAIYPADPDEVARRVDWQAIAERARRHDSATAFGKTFGPDGEPSAPAAVLEQIDPERDSAPGHVGELGLGEPVLMEMAAGDALLMDCRAFHYGAANTSVTPRAQLSATFREHGPSGVPRVVDGFTYELHADLVGKHRLGHFLGAAEATSGRRPSDGATFQL